MNQQWDSQLYDNKHSFVAEYGIGLLDLLQHQSNERILDLGCGTGDLAFKISQSCKEVVGVDASKEMIEKAFEKYTGIDFLVMDAIQLDYIERFDAVFSNAVLHWIKSPESVLINVHRALVKGGRFVAEFGGKNNCKAIVETLLRVRHEKGYPFDMSLFPWYFPTIGEYTQLMEKVGFEVKYATHYDRSTKLSSEAGAFKLWVEMFGQKFIEDLPRHLHMEVVEEAERRLMPILNQDGNWYADYRRIRVVGMKI